MKINHLALLMASMNWEEEGNRLLVPKSLTNLDRKMGMPDQSGKKDNLRGSSSPNGEVFALSKFDWYVPFLWWRFMFFVHRVTILTSSARSNASASGTSQKSFKGRRNKNGSITESAEHCALEWPPNFLHQLVLSWPAQKGLLQSTVRRHLPVRNSSLSPKKSVIDGVKVFGKVNVINCVTFIHHARHHLLEDQQIGEAGRTGYKTMLMRRDCPHFTNKEDKGYIQDLFKDFTNYRSETHGAVVGNVRWGIPLMYWAYNGQPVPASRRSTWGMHFDSSKTLSMD